MSRPSSSNNLVYLQGWGTGYLGMWVCVCYGGGVLPCAVNPVLGVYLRNSSICKYIAFLRVLETNKQKTGL